MRGALLGLLFLCTGCQPEPTLVEIDDPRLIVYSMLTAGSDSVRVMVSRVKTQGADDTRSALLPVLGADVRIIHGRDSATLRTISHCIADAEFSSINSRLNDGCYAGAIPGGVRAGERYELFVAANGPVARGEAVVPTRPLLHSPAAGVELEYTAAPGRLAVFTPVHVRWSGTEADRLIELRFRTTRSDCQATIARPPDRPWGENKIPLTGDTATVSPYDVHCPQGTQSTFPAELVLTVYDSAYTKYMKHFEPAVLRPEDAAVGLTEGLGLFAATASVALPVTLVRR